VFCLCSKADHVLKYLAPASRIASLGLAGYGDLGHRGPELTGVNDTHAVRTLMREDLGHGDWFNAVEFERTMETLRVQALHP
jgi:hypothetical protein